MFSHHPKWVYFADKPAENAIYCCHKTIIIVSSGMEFCEKMIFRAVTKICLLVTFMKWCTIASDNGQFLGTIVPKTKWMSPIWNTAYPHLLLTVKWPTGTWVWSHFFFPSLVTSSSVNSGKPNASFMLTFGNKLLWHNLVCCDAAN